MKIYYYSWAFKLALLVLEWSLLDLKKVLLSIEILSSFLFYDWKCQMPCYPVNLAMNGVGLVLVEIQSCVD